MTTKTIFKSITSQSQSVAMIPPLESGDFLSRAEFKRRYQLHPEIKKAELIEGVVIVASPVRIKKHGYLHNDLTTWVGMYQAATPGVRAATTGSVWLAPDETELQPDIFLRLEDGGQSTITEDDYLEGAPELIIEIAASSVSYDMNSKKRVYAQHGVQEYIVAQVYEQKLVWFRLREGEYQPLSIDEEGIIHSEIFPGLQLNPVAFWAGDLATMLQVLQAGLKSPKHADFVKQLSK